MATSNSEATSEKPKGAAGSGNFPWMPVLAVAGIAAAAFFLLKRLEVEEDSNVAMDRALDQCDRAASQLEARMRRYSEDRLTA